MANIFNNFFPQLLQGDTVKDWSHASKLFVAGNYALAPKNTFLYHVFFDLNSAARQLNQVREPMKQTELGMMVKQISLPKFSIDTKTMNAYNRAHIVQTKIKYDTVSMTFHDDAANVVRNFWFDYYNYYYRDSDYGTSQDLSSQTMTHDEITSARQFNDWGYTIRGTTSGKNITQPYLNAIRIYSLYNKQFSEYILINPMIKSFQHGEHNASLGNETMQHVMMVDYEAVLYAYGNVSKSTVHGFLDLHYDQSPSPLSPAGGGTQSILGPGGIAQSVGEISNDLVTGNFGAALFKGARVTNGLKGVNIGSIILPEALALGKNILTGNNPFGQVAVPGIGNLFGGKAVTNSGINNMETSGVGAQGIQSAAFGSGGLTGIASAINSVSNGIESLAGDFATNALQGASNLIPSMPANLLSDAQSALTSGAATVQSALPGITSQLNNVSSSVQASLPEIRTGLASLGGSIESAFAKPLRTS